MISIEILKFLANLLRKNENCRFDGGESVTFSVTHSRQDIEAELVQMGINSNAIGTSEISINLRQFIGLFFDRDHFLRESVNTDIFEANIGILFYTPEKYSFYEAASGVSYIDSNIDVSEFFIQNTNYYLKFYKHFEQLELSEHNSSTSHEFVLVDPEKGKFLLGYPILPPNFSLGIDLKEKYKRFENINQTQEFRFLFKKQIIESLLGFEHDQKFPKFVENIDDIIRDTENNYEMFLRKFDFEELKKNFRKERDEYFESVRSIVDKLLGKVVSIPISVSAAAITIYNLKDDPNYAVIIIVLIAYIVYSMFTSFLMRLLHLDSYDVKQDLNNDLQVIKETSNIPEDILKKESLKVYKKIDVLNTAIFLLQFLLSITSLAVLVVSFLFFNVPLNYIMLISSFVLVLQVLISIWGIRNKVLETKNMQFIN